MNVYIFEPETVQLTLTPTYTSSWSAGARFDSLTLMSPAGVALGSAYIFEDTMTLSVSDLLDAAGVDLDAENKNSGGRGLEDGTDELNTNSAFNWPTYRTTGVALRAKVRVTNFRAKQPLNFNVTGEIYVEIASDGAWTSAPVDVDYFGDADVTFDGASVFVARLARVRCKHSALLTRPSPPRCAQRCGLSGATRASASSSCLRASLATRMR
jgi:hypothetical protein